MCLQPIKAHVQKGFARSVLIESSYKESDFVGVEDLFEKEYIARNIYVDDHFYCIDVHLIVSIIDGSIFLTDLFWYDDVSRQFYCDINIKLN